MEQLLIYIAAFVRPLIFIEYGGVNLFDVGALLVLGAMITAFLFNTAVRQEIEVGAVDITIAFFAVWCVAISVIYSADTLWREVARLLIPLFTYVVVKNVVRDRDEYFRLMGWMIIGFVIPTALSVWFTLSGRGVEIINYWTGVERWRGIYHGSHDMGHNMAFLLMLIALYLTTNGHATDKRWSTLRSWGLAVLAAAAAYCLYMSRVRTTLVGVTVFAVILSYRLNRKVFVGLLLAVGLIASLGLPFVKQVLFPDLVMVEKGVGDRTELLSGRPRIWMQNLKEYWALPLDRQLAGVGVGSTKTEEEVLDSHNDYLDILLQTGVVGLMLFILLQALFLRAIFRLPDLRERVAFAALFCAVNVMNLLSNSYVARFGLGQMLLMILAYIELYPRWARSRSITAPNIRPMLAQ